jgi:hypothetical protein
MEVQYLTIIIIWGWTSIKYQYLTIIIICGQFYEYQYQYKLISVLSFGKRI